MKCYSQVDAFTASIAKGYMLVAEVSMYRAASEIQKDLPGQYPDLEKIKNCARRYGDLEFRDGVLAKPGHLYIWHRPAKQRWDHWANANRLAAMARTRKWRRRRKSSNKQQQATTRNLYKSG
jgi:hypothetical protein